MTLSVVVVAAALLGGGGGFFEKKSGTCDETLGGKVLKKRVKLEISQIWKKREAKK